MATLSVFKSHAAAMGYVFKSGKTVHFMNGMYATSNKDEIEELTKECEDHSSNYYIQEGETEIDSAALDPIAALRARIREEKRAKLIEATQSDRDFGNTNQSGKLEGMANSRTVSGASAQSEAQAAAARVIIPAKASASKL
jgi:hypothetical protein